MNFSCGRWIVCSRFWKRNKLPPPGSSPSGFRWRTAGREFPFCLLHPLERKICTSVLHFGIWYACWRQHVWSRCMWVSESAAEFLSHVWRWKHSQIMIQCRRQEVMRFCAHLPLALFPGALRCSLFSYLSIALIDMSLCKCAVSHTPAVCLSPAWVPSLCSSGSLFIF